MTKNMARESKSPVLERASVITIKPIIVVKTSTFIAERASLDGRTPNNIARIAPINAT